MVCDCLFSVANRTNDCMYTPEATERVQPLGGEPADRCDHFCPHACGVYRGHNDMVFATPPDLAQYNGGGLCAHAEIYAIFACGNRVIFTLRYHRKSVGRFRNSEKV